jgi:Alpha/beta hydrolase domain
VGPVTTGHIIEPTSPVPVDLAANGYVEQELFASGRATAYQPSKPLQSDGTWSVKPQSSASYRTRFVVRRPQDPSRFNGTVLVEWLNVSGGVEAAADWAYLNPEIVRAGYAYVGVSAQAFGVNGGHALLGAPGVSVSGGLVAGDPTRYGTLIHPGDQYSYDMFSQIGEALRGSRQPSALGSLRPKRVVAIGESQSAFFLTTYINAVQPMQQVYDGFFVHSRSGGGAALSGQPIASSSVPMGVKIRGDLGVPVFMFETETDVGPLLNYGPARQPDTDRIRTWEVAGTAHADAYLVGNYAGALGCNFTVNEGPQHVVVQAALASLHEWLEHGTPPARAARLQLSTTDPPVIARDSLGNAVGGVRTPAVDVPVAALSGIAPAGASILCSLFGSTTPFDGSTLTRLHHDKSGYLTAYQASLGKAIAARFLLSADRETLLEQASGVQFPS